MGKKEQMGRGVRIQCRWKKVQQLQGRLVQADGDWGPRTISPLCKTHTFQYQLPILTLLMACGNYSHVESQFSQYHWISLYLSLIFMSWPMCQVYFRSQRKDSVPSHKHGWGGFSLLGPSSLLFPQPHPPGKHCPCTAGKEDCWGPRHHYGPAGQGTALKIEHWTAL